MRRDRSVYRVHVDPVDAPGAVEHVRHKAALAVVTEVVHKSEHGGLAGVCRVARREAEVEEEVRTPPPRASLGRCGRGTRRRGAWR